VKNARPNFRAESSRPPPDRGHGRDAAGVWLVLTLLAALLGAGCQTLHQVTVDAISNPKKSIGQSYELEVIDPSGGVEAELQAMAVATIKDTLAARGLFEAPRGVRPDSIITYTFGVGQGHINIVTEQNNELLVGPMVTTPTTTSKAVVVFDKSIELSAREAVSTPDPDHPGAPVRKGEEMWNIKATIVDSKSTLAPYLSALGSAIIDYIGENSGKEVHLTVDAKTAKELLKKRGGPSPEPPPVKQPAK
jgi:hypothetical protein